MAPIVQTEKKQGKSKNTAEKKAVAMKKTAKKKTAKKKLVKKKAIPKKKLAKKRPAAKKAAARTKAGRKKSSGGKTASAVGKQVRGQGQSVDTTAFARERLGARSGEQAGDLQGLSNVEGANSESVDELLEEGNAFEAEVVKGVEDADDADEKEVHTHEVPQDDVDPSENDRD